MAASAVMPPLETETVKQRVLGAGYEGPGTEALLLNCMDYRLVDDVTNYMRERELLYDYDQVSLAGASIGIVTTTFPAWGQTFWDHVEAAIALHQVRRIIIMDHRDCGAYKLILGYNVAAEREHETKVHTRHMRALRAEINCRYPQLGVELLIMDLDGSVEELA